MIKPISLGLFEELDDNMEGMCIKCGAVRSCCEPDARRYPCEDCGERSVYGAQEMLLMGFVTDQESEEE